MKIKVLLILMLFPSFIFTNNIKLNKSTFNRDESSFLVINLLKHGIDTEKTIVKLDNELTLINQNIVNPYTIYLRIHVDKNAKYGKHSCIIISKEKKYPFTIRIEPKEHLLADLDTYDEYFFRFKFGYEYSSMEKIFEEGFPRLGFVVNFTTRSKKNPKIGLQISADIMLSSTPFINTIAGVTNTNVIDKAFEFYATTFIHFFSVKMKVDDDILHGYFGPVFLAGGTMKEDFTGQSSYQFYGGFRMSINPEVYTDFLFGVSENLEGPRLFIRAMLPIYKISNKSRIYIGAFGNFSLRNKGVDFVRIFLSADFDLAKLITSIF